MANKTRNSPDEVYIKQSEKDGYDLDGIPLKTGKVGDFYGKLSDGTEREEAEERPISITAENLSALGNRAVVADCITVAMSVMGKKQEVQIESLRFTKGTSHWPNEIRAQIPEIAEMVELRRLIREVQQNPRLKKQFVAWLRQNQDSQNLLDAISAEAG